jgi:hypothetical protein
MAQLLIRGNGAVGEANLSVHAGGEPKIVRDGDHGLAILVDEVAQDLEHLLAGSLVERTRGLVGQDQWWIVGERPGHGHTLALTA